MWADFPRNKHLKQAIYRGPGGAGDATGDATNASALALAARDEAQAAANSAASSATAAGNSATSAAASSTNADTQATSAASSASNAATSATAAASSATSADSSADDAAASAVTAAGSATAAASSATDAATSASAASSSDSSAASSASSASTSASTATTKASEAATSAANAAFSATSASTSATNASNSASAAATSETTAASSATAAASSASSASTSASTATTQATNASNNASAAATSATNASNSASAAATSATSASNSATSASTSATNAANSATSAAASAAAAATFDPALYLAKSGNLSGLASPSTSRTNLGVAIGTNVQAYSSELQAIANGGGNAMFKNRIINGAMRFDQRNAGAAVTGIGSAGTYIIDRWKSYATYTWSGGAVFAAQQNKGAVTPPPGFKNYIGVQTTTADATLSGNCTYDLSQAIEGFNIADLDWGTANAKSITFSFWVYSNLTGTFGGSLSNSASTYSCAFSYSVSVANTWTYCTVTVAGPTSGTWLNTNGAGVFVSFSLGCASSRFGTSGVWGAAVYSGVSGQQQISASTSNYLYITGVQLEKGSTATSFDYRPYGTELALCQRYYEVLPLQTSAGLNLVSGVYSGANNWARWDYKVTKRVEASIGGGSGYSTAFGGVGTAFFNNNGAIFASTSVITASAEL